MTPGEIVSVGDDGRLQCLVDKVDKDTVPEIPTLDVNHAVVDAIPDAVDWRAWLEQFDDKNSCEESVSRTKAKRLLPITYNKTGFKSCVNDTSLCCYFPPEGRGYRKEGFRLIEVADYWYRFHFQANPSDEEERYIHMSMIFRFCKDEDMCSEGETPPARHLPETTFTWPHPTPTNATSSRSSRRTKTKTATTSTTPTTTRHGTVQTQESDYSGAVITVAEVKFAKALPTSSTSRLAAGLPGILFSLSPSQKSVTVHAPLPSPDPVKHLIDGDRLDTDTLKEIVIDVADPFSDITGTQDFNITLLAGFACPSESENDCDLDYRLYAAPPSHVISREKFDVSTLATLIFNTIVNKEDPHIKLSLRLDLVCSAASKSCSMEHVLRAQPIAASEISLLTSRATTDGPDHGPLSV